MANEPVKMKGKKRRSRILLLVLFIGLLIGATVFVIRGNLGNSEEWLKNIPFAGTLFNDTEETVSTDNTGNDNQTVEKQTERADLKKTLAQKQAQIRDLKDEISVLSQRAEAQPSPAEEKATDSGVENVAQMYARMSPRSAAEIMIELEDGETVEILSAMETEAAAAILEKMPREQAAVITRLLTDASSLRGGETE